MKKFPDGQATQPDGVAPTNLKVSCLIDKEKREWKMETVREIFIDEDANIISSIYLSSVHMPNRLIWSESKSRELLVKIRYIMARKVSGKDLLTDASWKGVWRII